MTSRKKMIQAKARAFAGLWALGMMAFGVPAGAQASASEASVTIDAGRSGPVISRDIFGQFSEQLGNGIYGGVWVGTASPIPNVRGIRSDVVQALRALKVPNVRWPGGCFADQYHWRNGIGPLEQRPVRANINWGNPVEPNTFGTHEYMDFIDQIGSEAYLTVNVGSGTVQEAADWLEYMTAPLPMTLAKEREANGHAAPFRVKYLGIGNEAWGCGGDMSAQTYVDRMKTFSLFVRNLDPAQSGANRFVPSAKGMKRIAVGPADTDIGSSDTDYTEAVMKAWQQSSPRSRSIEGLSLHHYTGGDLGTMRDPAVGFGEKEYATFVRNTYAMENLIARHSAIMDKYDPEKKVTLAVDEWGVWLKPMPGTPIFYIQQQNSLRDAILASLNLNIFARHADRVRMANIAQMVNVLQSMILTDKEKMLLTPTYHVFRMYVPFQDATLIPITASAGQYKFGETTLPRIDTIAAKARDGTIWLAITNIDPKQAANVAANLAGMPIKSVIGEILTAANVNAVNSFETPSAVVPRDFRAKASGGKLVLDLPPASVIVVRLEI
ncbi:MAG TPA: alpha-L-arabinofuranosidase C-terminal domain-containing protein [Sphingobium sp.]|uniref:alpha-N-arabinofuranosidase n=1 Tax=Sphingobium sp. TaxID=1912891 RepID=UPI002ED0B05C